MSNPLYFVQSQTLPGFYLHYIGLAQGGTGTYELRRGLKGAALWPLQTALQLITLSGKKNLQPVAAADVLGTEPRDAPTAS